MQIFGKFQNHTRLPIPSKLEPFHPPGPPTCVEVWNQERNFRVYFPDSLNLLGRLDTRKIYKIILPATCQIIQQKSIGNQVWHDQNGEISKFKCHCDSWKVRNLKYQTIPIVPLFIKVSLSVDY